MITHHPQPESVRALRKEVLRVLLPDAQPAARMERLARSLGFASDAACTAHMRTTPHQPLHARRALELLEGVGRGDPLGFVVEAACSALYHEGTMAQWADTKALVEGVTAGKLLAMAGADPAALRSKPMVDFVGVWPYPGQEHKKALQAGMVANRDPWQQAAALEPPLRWFFACQTAYAVFPEGCALDVDDARQMWAYTLMLLPNFLEEVQRFTHLGKPVYAARPANDVWAEQAQPWVYTAHRGLTSLVHQGHHDGQRRIQQIHTVFEAVRTVATNLAQGRWLVVPLRAPETDLLGMSL